MQTAIRRAIAAFTAGPEAQRHFDLAAERIARALLEVTLPPVRGLEVGIHAEPARLVGGDYVDLFTCEDGALVFGMGDASGKSLAAALNALMLRYLVRGLVGALGRERLVEILTHTNITVTDDLNDDDFITFLLGSIDPATGALCIVNAGHEPPFLLAKDASTVATMDVHGIVLGISRASHYIAQEASLGVGDIAVFYTDGLTEATNERGEMYTMDGLKNALLEYRTQPAGELAGAMFDAVKRYATQPLRDDATILVLRRTE